MTLKSNLFIMKKIIYLLSGLTIATMPLMKFPQKEITNGLITAKIYLPDAKEGYYRGTRFDWSGNISSLKVNGHEYFGQWFTDYNPELHDAIMGPVQDFTPLNYPDIKPGETFLKIGVGVVTKPDNKPYDFSRLYPFVNKGEWSVKAKPDEVTFTHELEDKAYSYIYEKRVQLVKDKPEMDLIHTLKNTGTRTIETSVYDHNFFVIDGQPIGPGFSVTVPFTLIGTGEGIGELAEIKANQLLFLRNVNKGEYVFCSPLDGFGTSSKDYDFRIENRTTGAGVRITCDRPLLNLNFWCCSTTLCPEPYIKIRVEPGKEFTWKIHYEFYTLSFLKIRN
jgi:hypothetical protein